MVFGFRLVFPPCGMLQGAGRDQPRIWNPFCSTLWTGFCLTSLHTVILWRTMRYPMILSVIGWPSARASGVCLFRENKERLWICGYSPETSKRSSWPFHWRPVDHGWVSTGKLVTVFWVQWKFSAWQCREFTVCSAAWVRVDRKLFSPLSKSALCSKVRFNTVVAQTSTLHSPQASVWNWWLLKKYPVGTQPEAKAFSKVGQSIAKSKLIQAIIMNLLPGFFFTHWLITCAVLLC